MFPTLWQVLWDSRSHWVAPKFRLTSQDFCSGGAGLALVRPVVPYSLALSSQTGDVSVSFPIGSASQASYRMMALRPCKALISFSNLK